MPHIEFPKEMSQIATMTVRMQGAKLSEVHQAIEEFTDLSRKTGFVAQAAFSSNVFEAAMQRIEELGDREVSLNHQICYLQEAINDLIIDKDRLPPDQVAEMLYALQKQIFSCARPSTGLLLQQLKGLETEWNHLHFLCTFPLGEEFNPDSFISNYFLRVSNQIEHLKSTHPKQARRLKTTLECLEKECRAAEQVYCGKGLSGYQKLPKSIRQSIEQRLFERFPDRPVWVTDGEEMREIWAGAIIADLSDRIAESQ
jgi:hypothetical protein